jgi:hypothetical protein
VERERREQQKQVEREQRKRQMQEEKEQREQQEQVEKESILELIGWDNLMEKYLDSDT